VICLRPYELILKRELCRPLLLNSELFALLSSPIYIVLVPLDLVRYFYSVWLQFEGLFRSPWQRLGGFLWSHCLTANATIRNGYNSSIGAGDYQTLSGSMRHENRTRELYGLICSYSKHSFASRGIGCAATPNQNRWLLDLASFKRPPTTHFLSPRLVISNCICADLVWQTLRCPLPTSVA
jgi:hypothetical protein